MQFELFTALWIGILTSISPCPLATNIAAVSFIGKQVTHPLQVLLSGILYSIGRVISYVLVGFLIIQGILSVPTVAQFLQKYMNIILGPLLILVGIIMLDIIKLNLSCSIASDKLQNIAKNWGLPGSILLGFIFGLTFCPVSAGLFFGSLIPVAIKNNSAIIYPSLYGIGTALPVITFAILISFGITSIGKVFDKLTIFEKWARKITAIIFIVVGIYFIINHCLS
ncbi:MAG: aromatic aminobenezylarsenical efflux permease ArsG family transporter [Vampirovibrionia bacterium]